MLNRFSCEAVEVLATKAAKAGIRLVPLEGTPLSFAINACYNPSIDYIGTVKVGAYPKANTDKLDAFFIGGQLMEGSVVKDQGGVCAHDQAIEVFSQKAAKTISENNNIIRTVIVPMIERVLKNVENEAGSINKEAMNPLIVVPDYLPAFWQTPGMGDLIDKYRGAPVEDLELKLINPGKTGEELLTLIKTGSRAFDSSIEAYINQNEEARVTLRRVYQEMFSKRGEGEGVPEPSYFAKLGQYLTYDAPSIRDRLLFAHLLARKLSTEVPDGVNMSLGQFQIYMQTIVTQTARMMNRVIDTRADDIKKNNLVLSFPSSTFRSLYAETNTVITVNGDLYNDWIAAGGSPEIIFGAFVTGKFDRSTRNGDELLKDKDGLIALWKRQYEIRLSTQLSKMFEVTLTALGRCIGQEITELHNDNMIGVSRKPYFDLLESHLKDIGRDQLNDLEAVVIKLICRVLFPHRDVERIILCINQVGKANPELTDGREAALYGTIAFVSDWISKLYKITTESVETP